MKRAIVDSAREAYDSVNIEGKNPKSVWWNDVVKTEGGRIRLHG